MKNQSLINVSSLYLFVLIYLADHDSFKNVNFSISSDNNTIHSKKFLKDTTIYTLTDDESEEVLPGKIYILIYLLKILILRIVNPIWVPEYWIITSGSHQIIQFIVNRLV